MSKHLKSLVRAAASYLKDEHGFSLSGSRFTRHDDLMRSVWFIPQTHAAAGAYAFDVVLDLGIPGISTFSPRAQEWVVRAWADQNNVSRRLTNANFILVGEPDHDSAVEAAALLVVKTLCDEFLLRHATPEGVLSFVRESALGWLENDAEPDDEFAKLNLWPWTPVKRVELASVYAAFMGNQRSAETLVRLGSDYAARNRMDYAIPALEANILMASEKRGRQ